MDINKYFSGNKVSEICIGQSGANVYEVNGELQKIINTLALIHNDKIPDFLKKTKKEPLDKARVEYWHEFLHGNPEDRVKGIFDKLESDFQMLERL